MSAGWSIRTCTSTTPGATRGATRPERVLWVPFSLGAVKSQAGDDFGVDEKDAITIVLYNRFRVEERWTFGMEGPTDTQINYILMTTWFRMNRR